MLEYLVLVCCIVITIGHEYDNLLLRLSNLDTLNSTLECLIIISTTRLHLELERG